MAARKARERRARAAGGGAREAGFGAVAENELPSASGGLLRQFAADAVAPGFLQVLLICLTTCLSLGIAQFAGSEQTFVFFYRSSPFDTYWVLRYKAWWVAWIVVGYVIVPAVVMALQPSRPFRDCNLGFSGFRRHFWTYVGLYAAVLPVIWLVSLTPAFYTFYPMYPQAGRSWFDLLAWEGLYAGQFVALEFFFRGFLVGRLGRYIGFMSVPVSVMPYLMIHFLKPWPEAAASVVAGLVLGALAWKTKSIWGGVCVHCAVASTMDLLALSHKGQLPWLQG